jgi:hypothetical protein
VTRDDAFLLFELVFLGAAFLAFMEPILPATGARLRGKAGPRVP